MNNWTEVIERATDLDKQLKYEEAFEVIQAAVQEADAIIESGRYCDTDEIKYADINSPHEILLFFKIDDLFQN